MWLTGSGMPSYGKQTPGREGILNHSSLLASGLSWDLRVFRIGPPWLLEAVSATGPPGDPASGAVPSDPDHAPGVRIIPIPPGPCPSHDPGVRVPCLIDGGTSDSHRFSIRSTHRHPGQRSLLEGDVGGFRNIDGDHAIDREVAGHPPPPNCIQGTGVILPSHCIWAPFHPNLVRL